MENKEPQDEPQRQLTDLVKEEGTVNISSDDDAGSEHVLDDVHVTPGHYSESQNQKILSIQSCVNTSPMNTRLKDLSAYKEANPYATFKDFFRLQFYKSWEDASKLSSISRNKWPPSGRLSKQKPRVDPKRTEDGTPPYLENDRPPQLRGQMGCTVFQAANKLLGGARIIENSTRIRLVIEHVDKLITVKAYFHRTYLLAPYFSLPRPPERVQRIEGAPHDNQNSATFHHLAIAL
ncbi:hypothetical protein E3N88_19575 [Mikania micrantha]|uniref:Uncharacterized protein n=1 Tax=Mikania micrantha TaxID=192012 RepID=A0A5N6NPY2_9ASTR|nr:hypothetical protein E3N88_19575 [Mikania micrantha]